MLDIKKELIKIGVRLEGEFILKSGLRSNVKWDVEKLYSDTPYHQRLEILKPWLLKVLKLCPNWDLPDWIVGIPTGGYLLAADIAGRIRCPLIMAGYKLPFPGRVIIVDDVMTTGATVKQLIRELGIPSLIVAIAVLINRSELRKIDGITIISGIEADIVKQEMTNKLKRKEEATWPK